MHVLICGGGVIGTACAYELSRRGISVTLIERWRIGGCASGKSGGFLARDWCNGTPVAELARRSFDLHENWAERLGNTYGYRKVDTYGVNMDARAGARARSSFASEWLAANASLDLLGDTSTTAQLDPTAFTNALMQAAMDNRAKLKTAAVSGLIKSPDGSTVTGIALEDGSEMQADAVIMALGPWSVVAATWFPLAPIFGLKGHSLIFKPETAMPPAAIFAELADADGTVHTPEIVSRADGTVYVCGLPGTGGLPLEPAQVLPEDDGSNTLRDIAVQLVPKLAGAKIVAKQACFRPVTADGMPIIGRIADHPGLYVATGHSVWGMLNAPGTAAALSDLLLEGTSTQVDLTPFSPSRLAPLDPSQLEMQSQ